MHRVASDACGFASHLTPPVHEPASRGWLPRKSDPPARLPDPDDPWGLIIPSYAREPEDDGEK